MMTTNAPEVGKNTGEDSVLCWLDLIRLHISSGTTLAGKNDSNPIDKKLSMVLRNAKVNLVKATILYRDRQLFIKKFLNNSVMAAGEKFSPSTD